MGRVSRTDRLAFTALLLTTAAFTALARAQSPSEPVWGAYLSGVGYVVNSEALFERTAFEGIDPLCFMTVTVAPVDHPVVVANVANGLIEVLASGVTFAEAQEVMYQYSPHFNGDIDCVGEFEDLGGAGSGGQRWSSSYGIIEFERGLAGDRASYTHRQGRFVYSLEGTLMAGNWIQLGSAVQCETEVEGSFYWGTFEFVFDEEFTEFEGVWDHCGLGSSATGMSGTWQGSRVAGP